MNYITYNPSLTTYVYFKGYNLNRTKFVLLSTNNLETLYSLTAVNFSNNTLSGSLYTNYIITNKNEMEVRVCNLLEPGLYDIIFLNEVGYAKLTDEGYVINGYSIIVTPTPTITPSFTPSVTPTVTFTPTITPSITRTPNTTPSPTPTLTITSLSSL